MIQHAYCYKRTSGDALLKCTQVWNFSVHIPRARDFPSYSFNKPLFLLFHPGYSEDGGVKGDVIPEHEFAEGPVCLDDENEFPSFSH